MLCETETDEDDNVTGVGPAELPWPQCVSSCCGGSVTLQIRVRYKTGFALLCANLVDGGGDPDTYYTEKTVSITYHQFVSGTEVGTCTTTTVTSCPDAIVSGVSGVPDCDCPPDDNTQSPSDCVAHLYDPPVTSVTSDPAVITFGGDTATKDDARSAAIAAMAYGDWSDWADLVTINIAEGTSSAGYLTNYLSEASLGDNGAGAGSFVANATQYESELRIIGGHPISIAVSEGPDIATAPVNRYTLAPGDTQTFSVASPTIADGWETDRCVLRCVCPIKFAVTA